MQKYIKNTTVGDLTIEGQVISPSSYYLIQDTEINKFSSSSDLLVHISTGDILVAKSDDGTTDIVDVNTAIDYLKNNLLSRVESIPYPFSSKILEDGSKVYERKHGVTGGVVNPGQTVATIYSIPYASCKITAVEVVGSKVGDQVDFKVLDTPAGTVSTIPNYTLNQFGFGVFTTEGSYKEESRYDADLFLGLQLEMSYTNNGVSSVTPNYNITLHEVKS
jgi:hypothetical protein